MPRKKKKEVSLKSITIYCGYIDKEITMTPNEAEIEGWEASCDLCGGHGGARINFNCECGDYHSIDVNEW